MLYIIPLVKSCDLHIRLITGSSKSKEIKLPRDIDNFTGGGVEKIAKQVILRYNLPVAISDGKVTDFSGTDKSYLYTSIPIEHIYRRGPVYEFDFFEVTVDYIDEPFINNMTPKRISVIIENKYKIQEKINIFWYVPENCVVRPFKKRRGIYCAEWI